MTTKYTNSLQFSSEWSRPITTIWMLHIDATDGGTNYFLTGLDLVKDGPDLPAVPLSIPSWSGKPDTWRLAFLDADNNLFSTTFSANVPNQSGPGEIEITISGAPINGATNVVTLAWQNQGASGPFPLALLGTGMPAAPTDAAARSPR